MKLKSICDTFNDSATKPVQENNAEESILNETNSSSAEDSFKINNDSIVEDEIDENDNFSDGNETIEEFDPENPQDITECDVNTTIETSMDMEEEEEEENKNSAYRFDEKLKAYVKVDGDEEKPTYETIMVEDIAMKNTNVVATPSTSQAPIKTPAILKRKTVGGSPGEENSENQTKAENKLNIDLKDLKIPKLNLEDPANIKKEEDGIMYVTAKGSKPNEMLLIKVKKMEKIEKNIKKKSEINLGNKSYFKYSNVNNKGSHIEEQIEEYKRKRVEILGETAIISDENAKDESTEIRVAHEDSHDIQVLEHYQAEKGKPAVTQEDTDISQILDEMPTIAPQYVSRLEKLKQRWKDIKKRHDAISKDLAEDCTDRLKAILKQKDEYIQDFISYLKQRRIVASRLKDDDIISLYEMKNNVVLEKATTIVHEAIEDADPFEYEESYPCDFCDLSFTTRDSEFEHEKIHDIKLVHYCEDCKQEFPTYKAKRAHNISCLQKLTCKYCDMMLESKGKKRLHEQKHCDEMYGQLCEICGEKFKHIGTLDQHVKSRHMQLEKIFKCPQCSKRFAFRTKLTFHLKSVHTTSRAYLCEDCGSDFKNPASLRHHRIRKHQTSNNKKECPVCKKSIPVYSMSKHMHTHKAYTIECPHCDKMFKNSSTLKQHLRIHEDQRQYKCDMCGVGFNRRDGLRLHLKVHQKADSRGLKECSCQVCGEKFPNHSMLVIHRNRTHKDGRNYTCHICNRSMISTRSLEWHLSHIHNETMPGIVKDESSVDAETKRVSCYHCHKTFKTEMILRTHVKNTHVEKEPMKCLDCDAMFTSDVRLKHHMMVTHNRLEGTLACPHCPKRFVNQLRLKTHMIAHSNERPHSCDICGFMLKTKIQLIKHKQNRHSNERPLQCKYCSWRCKQVSALVCHERTHTNERPYSCSVCKQKFKYLGDKNKHERRHESLGGSGFKRIVTGRNTNRVRVKRDEDNLNKESDHEQDFEVFEEEHNEGESFDENEMVKFETIPDESETGFEQMYVEDTSQDTNDEKAVEMSVEEATIYTEEVSADHMETQIIANGMIDESLLQPGTVVHLQQQDETGKIQMIPVMLALPDLTDATSEVSLATASIMYNN